MNKKLFFGMFAAATMLFATSCSNDEMDGLKGNESVVSFTLEQPGISTRAYSDGLSAERLSYAVFEVDANGAVATTPTYEDVIDVAFTNKQANITFALEKGKTYKCAFWADNAESPYEFDANTGKVTVDYTDESGNNLLLSNDENRDAFFANDEVTIPEDGSSVIKTITLYRPFAQLNIGAIGNDAVGLENPTKSEVSIASGVYSTLNILTGEVEDEVAGGVTYALNTIPEATEVFPVDGVDNYFSMNYLLVSKDKALVEVGFTLASDNNQKSRTFANIPVQRNHRTNIYGTIGNIISEAAEFTCTIDERYDEPENNYIPGQLSVIWAEKNVGATTDDLVGSYLNKADALKQEKDGWRLPTEAECLELLNNCDWEETTVDEVKGYQVSNSVDGQSFFIPKAGYKSSANGNVQNYNRYFMMWTSKVTEQYYQDWMFANTDGPFNTTSLVWGIYYMSSDMHMSVRLVKDRY